MSIFEAVFVAVDGLNEREIQFRKLSGDTLADASVEAMNLPAPKDANFIKILEAGHLVHRIGIGL